MHTDASYALFAKEINGNIIIFMGNGNSISSSDISVKAEKTGNVVVKIVDGELYMNNEVPVILTYKGKTIRKQPADWSKVF